MPSCDRFVLVFASLLAFAAVILGAFAAHGLQKKDFGDIPVLDGHGQVIVGLEAYQPLKAKRIDNFQVAARYQMWHALAIFVLGLVGAPRRLVWVFSGGILLFSGSLYLLVMTGITKLGMVTPIGGTLFLIGWLMTAHWSWKSSAVGE